MQQEPEILDALRTAREAIAFLSSTLRTGSMGDLKAKDAIKKIDTVIPRENRLNPAMFDQDLVYPKR